MRVFVLAFGEQLIQTQFHSHCCCGWIVSNHSMCFFFDSKSPMTFFPLLFSLLTIIAYTSVTNYCSINLDIITPEWRKKISQNSFISPKYTQYNRLTHGICSILNLIVVIVVKLLHIIILAYLNSIMQSFAFVAIHSHFHTLVTISNIKYLTCGFFIYCFSLIRDAHVTPLIGKSRTNECGGKKSHENHNFTGVDSINILTV